MSKYEPSLYANVDEMGSSMGRTTTFDNWDPTLENNAVKNSGVRNQDSKL